MGIAAAIALMSTVLSVTRTQAVHALLFLVVSFLAVASVYWQLGAPLAAALQMLIYAGAIVVLFVFAVMLLDERASPKVRLTPRMWVGPIAMVSLLVGEIAFESFGSARPSADVRTVNPDEVGRTLYGPYILATELASLLLLAGLVGAFHLGRPKETR
jgi:NADH-quinone oxidoreductase subunit J